MLIDLVLHFELRKMGSNTKEQRTGVAEIEAVIQEETRGHLLPGLSERKAVYPPLLNGLVDGQNSTSHIGK